MALAGEAMAVITLTSLRLLMPHRQTQAVAAEATVVVTVAPTRALAVQEL